MTTRPSNSPQAVPETAGLARLIAVTKAYRSNDASSIDVAMAANNALEFLLLAASMEQNDRRWRELFDGDHLLFVGQWCSKEGRDSGEGEWIMLMEEQVSAALGKEK